MPRAIALTLFDARQPTARDDVRDAIELLWERGYDVVVRGRPAGDTTSFYDTGVIPSTYVAELRTACGARQSCVLPWPPRVEIRVPLASQVLSSDPIAPQRMSFRRFAFRGHHHVEYGNFIAAYDEVV